MSDQHSDSMEEPLYEQIEKLFDLKVSSSGADIGIYFKTSKERSGIESIWIDADEWIVLRRSIEMLVTEKLKHREAYAQQVAREAEDNLIKKSHQQCECGSDHFATPVRSVQGNITTYCQFRRVRLSELDKESKT